MTAALVQKQARVKNHTGRLVLVRSRNVVAVPAVISLSDDCERAPQGDNAPSDGSQGCR